MSEGESMRTRLRRLSELHGKDEKPYDPETRTAELKAAGHKTLRATAPVDVEYQCPRCERRYGEGSALAQVKFRIAPIEPLAPGKNAAFVGALARASTFTSFTHVCGETVAADTILLGRPGVEVVEPS